MIMGVSDSSVEQTEREHSSEIVSAESSDSTDTLRDCRARKGMLREASSSEADTREAGWTNILENSCKSCGENFLQEPREKSPDAYVK